MQPDTTLLMEKIGLELSLVGFYDAPVGMPFEPLVAPVPGKRACIFAFFRSWQKGKTLHLTPDNIGCPGARHWLFCRTTRSREDFVKFLVDEEGLKANHELMDKWLDYRRPYEPQFKDIYIGPLRADQYQYLRSVTFFANPDQLSALLLGAQYHSEPGDPEPVIAPFGSGCMQLVPLFDDLAAPQAMIGATDLAMRKHLAPDLLAFTVTKPMFERLCTLDETSFLYKRFWKELCRTRGLEN